MSTTRVSRSKPVESQAGDRHPMPEATFLQIQGRGDATYRMIEMPFGPVRIGRGAHCEVRLDEPDLGEVQCMLRKRGTNWHFQPVGPPGHAWIDGRPADQQRPLTLGVPFRVGEHWLTLRPADSAYNDWGSFETPITIEPEGAGPIDAPIPEPLQPPSTAEPERTLAAGSSSDDNEERLQRWQARLEQRERWLKDRQDERRWEARWKAAGETIRARSTPAVPSNPAPSRPAPRPPDSPSKSPPRPRHAPPVARIIEPRPSEPLRRVAEPSPRPTAPRVPVRPISESTAPVPRPVAAPRVRVTIKHAPAELPSVPISRPEPAPSSRALVALPSTQVDWSIAKVTPVEEMTTAASELQIGVAALEIEPIPAPEARVATVDPAEEIAPIEVEPVPDPEAIVEARELEFQDEPISEEIEAPSVTPLIESSGWIEELTSEAPVSSLSNEQAPATIEPQPAEPIIAEPRWTEPGPVEVPARPVGINAEWPSAKAIFAAQGRRPLPSTETAKTETARPRRRKPAEPEPTDVLAPAQWTLPLWLGWFPVLLVALVFGSGGLALAYGWAVESNAANVAMRLALRDEKANAPPIDVASIPRGGWWLSNASHLTAWAIALERSTDGEDHSEDVRSLFDAARNASQLSARSRFVLEPAETAENAVPADLSHLGRPREVVTLVWTARRLRKAGKTDASLRAYRSAMEIAAKSVCDEGDVPAFDEDRQVLRYALPREALLGLVARDMAEAGEWTREQWTEALPPSAAATLVASRVLAKKQQRAEADRLADLAIRQAGEPTPPGFDPAEQRAAGAEALAYRGRWTDAAEQYRRAIDLAEDDTTRRMWWLNLAELAHRVDDASGRARAIEAAKAPDSSDEITRRALKYQQNATGLASSGPRR